MLDDQSGFCANLQADWSVDELVYERGGVTIRVSGGSGVPYPNPEGRPGHLVTAEPTVFREERSAEIRFKSVIWCQIVDEFSFAVSEARGPESDEEFVGSQFRCYSRSRLLAVQRGVRVEPDAARVKHYQLVTDDEVIDIVSAEAPDVTIRAR